MKYMLIDYSDCAKVHLLKVAHLREAQLWGAFYEAQGRKVMAPPVAGRSFAKFDGGTLRQLYQNLTGIELEPNAYDYGAVVSKCLEVLEACTIDATPEDEIRRLLQEVAPAQQTTQHVATGEVSAQARPRQAGATGRVWEIADKLNATGQLPSRQEVMQACEVAGINPATASTQYAKWKKQLG